MKKTTLLLALLAHSILSTAQVFVEGVKLDPSNTGQYIELDPSFRDDGRCAIQVDYGQSNPKEDFVTDDTGKRYDFRSLIDGLNFFYEEGWELAQITMVGTDRRFFLKRRY